MRSTRRALLAAGGAAAVLPLSWPGAWAGTSDADRLRAAVADPASAALLGRAYVARFPQEIDRARLAAAVMASLPAPAPDGGALRRLLRARIRGDFRDGATIALDGWILSRTEARLAALWA